MLWGIKANFDFFLGHVHAQAKLFEQFLDFLKRFPAKIPCPVEMFWRECHQLIEWNELFDLTHVNCHLVVGSQGD